MCSVQSLREFISQRLTAAAAEIFSEFEKTLVQYEEVIDRQRRLLDVTCRPETKPPAAGTKNTNRTGLPQQHVCKEEEVPEDQQLCYQETNSSLDQEKPDLPQMKEEDEEVCSSQEGEQLVVKQETETSMLTPTHQEGDLSEAEANTEQLYSHSSPVTERTDHEDPQNLDSGLSTDVEMNPVESHPRNGADSKNEDHSYVSQSQLDTQSCEKPFKCDVCGKTFRWKSFIEQHSRIHTGVKPYDCKTCGKKFTQKSTLVQHMRIHTGERPYSCEKCGKDFTNRSNLRTHMIVHVLEKS